MSNNPNISPAGSCGVRVRNRVSAKPLPTPLPFDPKRLRLGIKYVTPSDLKAPRRALRRYEKRAMQRMKKSINDFGFIVALVVDRNGRIVVGHRRWLAAIDLKLDVVPVVEIAHLTEEQLRIFTILDNKLCEDGEWDVGALRVEFEELAALPQITIEDSGFSTAEVDNLWLAPKQEEKNQPEDEVPEALPSAVTRFGDIWQLGQHRLICGNSLEEATFEQLLGRERAQMVFCDAPYNLSASTISGKGKRNHGDFAMATGEMAVPEFTTFLATCFAHLAKFSIDGSIHYQCMDFRHMREMLDAGYGAYSELKNLVVWKKHSAGMGSFYRSQHELVFVWKSGTAPHINNFGLGETGRHRSNVWEYRGNAGFHRERDDELSVGAPAYAIANARLAFPAPGVPPKRHESGWVVGKDAALNL